MTFLALFLYSKPRSGSIYKKSMAIEIKMRKGEAVEKALRRLKKKLDREEVILAVREKRYFKSPSRKKQEKKKELKFNDMLRNRYRDL